MAKTTVPPEFFRKTKENVETKIFQRTMSSEKTYFLMKNIRRSNKWRLIFDENVETCDKITSENAYFYDKMYFTSKRCKF